MQPDILAKYEEEQMAALSKNKAGAKSKAKAAAKSKAKPKSACKAMPVLKKPAAKSAQTSATSAQHGYYGKAPAKGPFGCLRCRGNVKGCDQCIQPSYAGLRFSSRASWVAWKKAKDGHH